MQEAIQRVLQKLVFPMSKKMPKSNNEVNWWQKEAEELKLFHDTIHGLQKIS